MPSGSSRDAPGTTSGTTSGPAPNDAGRRAPGWRRKARGFLALARVSNAPTVVSNALAGAALGAAAVALEAAPLGAELAAGGVRSGVVAAPAAGAVALLACAMVLFYTGGMILNDVCDRAIDARERPERPLPSGVVTVSEARMAVALAFAAGLALLWPLGIAPLVGGGLLVGVIVAYDVWHKSNPLSPLLMAATRALVYLTAYAAIAGPAWNSAGLPPALLWTALLGAYIVALTQIAKAEGRRGAMRYWPAALLFAPAAWALWQLAPGAPSGALFGVLSGTAAAGVASGLETVAGVLLVAVFAGWVGHSLSFVYRRGTPAFGAAISRLIAGVALLDALVLAAHGLVGAVLLALAAFALTLFAQRFIKGT